MTAATVAEELIWLLAPMLSFGAIGYFFKSFTTLALCATSAMFGLVLWALAPRCMCSGAQEQLAGSFVLAISLGAAAALMFFGSIRIYRKKH